MLRAKVLTSFYPILDVEAWKMFKYIEVAHMDLFALNKFRL